jgi:hypothetical protein
MTDFVLELLLFIQTAFLFASVPLSTIAAYGFRGTPWGRVLLPLPLVEVSLAAGIGIGLLDAVHGPLALFRAGCFAVGVLGVALITFRLARVATGGVRA